MPTELENSYRNLMITLARHYMNIITLAKGIRMAAEVETNPGRKSGLYCHSGVMRRYAHELRELLMENRAELRDLFGTSNLMEISKQQLRLPYQPDSVSQQSIYDTRTNTDINPS